jgi:hypothetical protein
LTGTAGLIGKEYSLFRGSGFKGSGFSAAAGKKTAGQIEKETNILLENGIGFHEVSYKRFGFQRT